MNKELAKQIIKETFEQPFDKNRFVSFIKNLLNHIEESTFSYHGTYIPDAYRPYISIFERVGKFNDGENRIDILIVKLSKDTSFERARTRQRNFVAGYLQGKYGSSNEKEAALVAFVSPNDTDWRFSLVKMDYTLEQTKTGKSKVNEEFTPARRWSFLVGANEKSHTAQSQLVDMLADDEKSPNLSELEKAFNIETVTKEFFLQYRDLFIRTKEALDKTVNSSPRIQDDFKSKGVNTVDFSKKLLGQIVFLYFLQKKGWFGVERDANWGTGSKQFLRELFEKKHGVYKNFFNEILEPLFYEALRIDRSYDDDYYSRFNCKIPFLNGGLFDPIGNYNWVHTDILLTDSLFSNENKTMEGDIGNGILDVFDRYNFTVREDEPMEKEVAIDPELLGKAYEKFNAIRPDNFEEYKKALKSAKKGDESKFNKQYGVYYTPREIVHYMCQQSLINYLATECSAPSPLEKENNGKGVIAKSEVTKQSLPTKEDIEALIYLGEQVSENEAIVLIKEEKINAGEQKTTKIKPFLKESIRLNANLIDKKLEDITVCDPAVGSGAFPVGMMGEIVKTRNVLTPFIKDNKRTPYEFKRQCIEHSLYGVDIDPGAVEIAKLRLWLSLVVDEDDIKNIKPLPNLDYKIVCGNSLLGVEKNMFNHELFNKLEELKPRYFNETNPTRKQDYREEIDGLISQITNGHKEFDFEVYFSEVFHNKSGFDVLIANPPYINVNEMKKEAELYRNLFITPFGSYDIYILFFEKSMSLLKEKGILTFITSNKYFIADYAKNLRRLILDNTKILILIDLADFKRVFEHAFVSPAITIIQKIKPSNYTLKLGLLKDTDVYNLNNVELSSFDVGTLATGINFIFDIYSSGENKSVLEKIDYDTVTLDKIAEVRTGIMGFEYWKMQPYIRENKQFGYIRIITNGQVDRYSFLFDKKTKLYKKLFRNPYLDIKEAPINKNTKQLFVSKKIIIRGVAKKLSAQFDDEGFSVLVAVHTVIPKKPEMCPLYLLALINSSLFNWYHITKFYTARIPMGSLKYPISFLKSLPIKFINIQEQRPFIEIVDKILDLTKTDDYLKSHEKQKKVEDYEHQIDQMVYELYGLTESEIQIVENIGKKY